MWCVDAKWLRLSIDDKRLTGLAGASGWSSDLSRRRVHVGILAVRTVWLIQAIHRSATHSCPHGCHSHWQRLGSRKVHAMPTVGPFGKLAAIAAGHVFLAHLVS
ncbi:hypothetical protein L1887_54509 [Cichorium endivia]|nr:hypothetical protein L1887_54509 [Cichorium endivia]